MRTLTAGIGAAVCAGAALFMGWVMELGGCADSSRMGSAEMGRAPAKQREVLFTEGWQFCKGDMTGEAAQAGGGAWKNVDLPHDWSIEGPFDQKWAAGTGFLPTGVGWYRKTFVAPAEARDK